MEQIRGRNFQLAERTYGELLDPDKSATLIGAADRKVRRKWVGIRETDHVLLRIRHAEEHFP